MGHVVQDLRFALRSFARTPRFTVPAVLALALGIGATSAIFSVVQAVMLKPLPYRDPDRIVTVWESHAKRNRTRNVIGPANFVEWRARNRSFSQLGMIGPSRLNLMLGGHPEEISGSVASADVFAALGVQPALGRTYTPEEDFEGRDLVMVVSHEFWQSRLGADRGVIGRTINASGRPRTVIGVMPPGFTVLGERSNFFFPYGWTLERLRSAPGRGSSHGIARLRDGVSLEQAAEDMKTIAAQLEQEAPQRNTGWSVTLVPVHEQMVEQIRPALRVLAGAVAMVLLIACVNVANLLLARSTIRQRELGLRAALGARRGRLVRQMLSESLLLGLIGGIAGLLLAYVFHRGLLTLVADRIPVPRIDQVALDLPVLAFTFVLALLTGLAFGIIPATIASRSVNETLREGGRHGGGVRSRRALGTLVVVEVAVSLVLLAGAGLLIRSFIRLQNVNPGFRAEGVLTARVQVPAARYDDDRKIAGFYARALERIAALPGVRDAAGITFLPLAGPGIGTSFYRGDQPVPPAGAAPTTDVRPISTNFFRTMGIPHVAGRDFGSADQADSPPVAIVSETLVKQHFAGESPLGRRIHVNIGQPAGRQYEIVGVVGDIKIASLEGDVRPAVYLPHPQLAVGLMTFVVRTDMDPHALTNSVGAAVRDLDPELPLADVRTMEEVVDATLARPRVVAVLLTAFAVMALVLAGVGVYGVMAYSVAHRTQEIGVRMALGATPESVFRLVLGQALRLVAIGIVAGVAVAAAVTRGLETLLFETERLDPWTFGITAVVLVIVATVASYVPARRGTRVAPVEALRAE
jgi:putative ABC transport system permease protein